MDVFHADLLRIRELRAGGRSDEAQLAAAALSDQLDAAGPGSLTGGWRLRVQVSLEWSDALCAAGRYPEALPHLLRGLAVSMRELGEGDADTGSAWNSVGVWHRYRGSHDQSLDAYRRALSIAEAVGGPDCVDVASILHNIASLYQTRGDARAAEQPARRAVRIRRAALDARHPDVAADLGVLGVVLADLGRFGEAASCYARARRIFADPRSVHLVELAYLSCNEAALRHLRGDLAAADAAYQGAQQACIEHLGPRHPQVAAVLLNRATLALVQDRRSAAQRLAAQCETILAGVVTDEHPHLIAARAVRADAVLPALP